MDPTMTSCARSGREDRPDPIARAGSRQADSLAVRGTLRTYLGIAPGVGKTYAMLRDARARRRAGTDTVVAYWERHGRPATVAQLGDLEVIPARTVVYRGASFAELDVEAVLDRRPELAVTDELAHANLPGERHAKRWQDVGELLASGIDVYTTLNVANIESLGPTVSRITGVRQAEPVRASVVMAGLEGSPADEWLIRYAAHLAELSDARLKGVHIRSLDNLDRVPAARLEKDRKLLGELGGTFLEVRAGDVASGLIQAARQTGAGQLVIGSHRRSRWTRLLAESTMADQLHRAAGDLTVQVVNVGRPDKTSREWPRP